MRLLFLGNCVRFFYGCIEFIGFIFIKWKGNVIKEVCFGFLNYLEYFIIII